MMFINLTSGEIKSFSAKRKNGWRMLRWSPTYEDSVHEFYAIAKQDSTKDYRWFIYRAKGTFSVLYDYMNIPQRVSSSDAFIAAQTLKKLSGS